MWRWIGLIGNAPKGIKGKKNLNILMLAVVYKGVAIPVY